GGTYGPGGDSIILCNETLRINNASDATIIMKLDTAGNAICGAILRTGGDDNNGIACSYSGKYVYLGGDIGDTITFNKNFLFTDSAMAEPPFIARWQPCKGGEQGINNISEPNQTSILFPNPNKGVFTIQSPVDSRQSLVEIYNMLGEKVYTETLRQAQGDNSINISNQPAGIYLYRVSSEEGQLISSGKFVIEK
ncbi:MAG TPA: T9SS type A sorting domain-containing protein, partial [Bacteroidia bacterium]|nr:T9SS type A sorting domain-containing protein [Bacteroidia bacterium]